MEEQQQLPNSTVILVLGILALILGCCYGFGALLAIVAIVLFFKARRIHKENPGMYTGYGNALAGLILSILGLLLTIAFIGLIIWMINMFGLETLMDEELLREAIEEMQRNSQ
ncbi:MAG: CCC motif membrane protein [Bacteroidota bacterium]